MNITTVPYKGSKRKLLNDILAITMQVECETFFDGFCGTGIVSAYMRSKGYKVTANDKMPSCSLFARVFVRGFDKAEVEREIEHINNIAPKRGWLSNNYSGSKARVIKGTGGKVEKRPLGFTLSNAMKIDASRDYAEAIEDDRTRDAVIFSIILASNKVFNNHADQKSCLKAWITASQKDIVFECPTLIEGKEGKAMTGDISAVTDLKYDVVYLDPPYTHGVLYDACYHLNDSICLWDKPSLNHDYAIPRPERAVYRKSKNSNKPGKFYSQKTAEQEFEDLIRMFKCKRLILSYSDAPRNVLSYEQLYNVCSKFGKLTVLDKNHKICTQFKSQKKASEQLTEFFFIIDF
tara:strand:+ start:1179 stop:2225 length:1047 start_codon:yes stop_codon:yes gene_type:complete